MEIYTGENVGLDSRRQRLRDFRDKMNTLESRDRTLREEEQQAYEENHRG